MSSEPVEVSILHYSFGSCYLSFLCITELSNLPTWHK